MPDQGTRSTKERATAPSSTGRPLARVRLILLVSCGALCVSAIAATGAQADVYSCAVSAHMAIEPYNSSSEARDDLGVEAIVNDLDDHDDQWSDGPLGLPLLDTDNDNGRAEGGGEDGAYLLTTHAPMRVPITGGTLPTEGAIVCLYVSTGAGDPDRASGVYEGELESRGEYDNIVCFTGTAVDDTEVTSVTFDDPGVADLIDADYRVDFSPTVGTMAIRAVDNADGENGGGLGPLWIEPTDSAPNPPPLRGGTGVPCVTDDATGFAVSGAFAIATE